MVVTMIAVSGHKPHALNGEYRRNQVAAVHTWLDVFDSIYFFGPLESELMFPKVNFIATNEDGRIGQENFPTIKQLFSFMANQGSNLVAIINADIRVTPKLKGVEAHMQSRNLQAACSYRWQGDPPAIIDKGMDIFVARTWLWKILAREIPNDYRLGHCEWDTWVLGQLMRHTHWKMADFTPSRCIFHPIHDGRDRPLNHKVPKMPESQYDYAKLPGTKIRV